MKNLFFMPIWIFPNGDHCTGNWWVGPFNLETMFFSLGKFSWIISFMISSCLFSHSPVFLDKCSKLIVTSFFPHLFVFWEIPLTLYFQHLHWDVKESFLIWNNFSFMEMLQNEYREFPYTLSKLTLMLISYITIIQLAKVRN